MVPSPGSLGLVEVKECCVEEAKAGPSDVEAGRLYRSMSMFVVVEKEMYVYKESSCPG